MTEYKLFEGDTPHVSTFEFHADRERAPHLEQGVHRPRLERAAEFIHYAADLLLDGNVEAHPFVTVSDLGCGDGGLLSLLDCRTAAHGYDFQPSNVEGWRQRGVTAFPYDAFGKDESKVEYGDISVATEVLEHLADPHGTVKRIACKSQYLVASSPWTETNVSHDACHAWAWDMEGYRQLLEWGGFEIVRHEQVGMFQVILGRSVQ